MRRLCAPLLALASLLLGGGCGSNVWERSFELEPGAMAATPTESVVIRNAPWGRVGPALQAENERITQSDTHRDDWTAEEARESELALLGALQLPFDTQQASLLGRSNITTTRTLDPDGAELARFAESIGADYAIWSSRPLGKAQTIEREPVRRDRWRWERIWDADRRRFVYARRWEPDTVWIPVVVEREEVRWVVFYIRKD